MGYWNTRGLRGSGLEELINVTNELYQDKKMALVQKIPTPITPITIDKSKGVITLAYFEQKSTVDYIGVVQGVAICFDAKETTKESLPLANIHEHQIVYMEQFIEQEGEAFFIVNFQKHEAYYILPIECVRAYYDNAQKGGRKSIPHKAFSEKLKIPVENGLYINYIKTLSYYMEHKDEFVWIFE
ncbi:MAG: Holliday junction resolvase RecU [Cellulosilyticaceae bacterium]